jgi:hypothetical protein
MPLFRLYSGDDKQSHLEELKMPFAPGPLAEPTPLQPATGVIYSRGWRRERSSIGIMRRAAST